MSKSSIVPYPDSYLSQAASLYWESTLTLADAAEIFDISPAELFRLTTEKPLPPACDDLTIEQVFHVRLDRLLLFRLVWTVIAPRLLEEGIAGRTSLDAFAAFLDFRS